MNPAHAFINPQTNLLRSGWRVLIFMVLSPQLILPLILHARQVRYETTIAVNSAMIISYLVSIAWIISVSWLCLYFLDRLKFSSLGLTFYRGWWRDVLRGCSIGALMVTAIIGLQLLGGGTRITPNPIWWRSSSFNYDGIMTVAGEISAALLFLSIVFGVLSTRAGFPFLLVFLLVGALAGEDGPGGYRFDDFGLSFWVGNIALSIIARVLGSGG